ncbi:MAG: hypothetical protein AAGG11_16510 [Pseudomonadota bacterium]
MELKDIAVAADLETVRGGSNTIVQSSVNGPVSGSVAVGGFGFNLSPVNIQSAVGQANVTTQQALIEDYDVSTTSIDIMASQLSVGFPFGRRLR